jgi:SET domain-containing protein
MNKDNGKLVVKRTATGLGLFTLKTIRYNKRIVEYTGTILTNEEVDQRTGKYFFVLDAKRAIDGSSRENIARYINHSCRPNARGYTTGNRIWIWSLREIEAGEQITINYGKSYFDEHIKPVGCKCEPCVGKSPAAK